MKSFSKVKPDIPTETKHGLTHVVQMRHLEHFGYSSLSHFQISCRTFNTSLLDEANAFFWLWHFKVGDVKEATVSNYVQLTLASQNHKHASEIVLLDQSHFNMKSCSHTMLAAGLWIVRRLSIMQKLHSWTNYNRHKRENVVFFPFRFMKAAFTTSGRTAGKLQIRLNIFVNILFTFIYNKNLFRGYINHRIHLWIPPCAFIDIKTWSDLITLIC